MTMLNGLVATSSVIGVNVGLALVGVGRNELDAGPAQLAMVKMNRSALSCIMNGMPPGAWQRALDLQLARRYPPPEECMIASGDWPDLPFPDWAETCATLHLWMQVVGKVRLADVPTLNHWWQVPLYVTCRGLPLRRSPHGRRTFQIDFDFIDHILELRTSNGDSDTMLLCPRSVADFHEELMRRLRGLGLGDPDLDHAGRDPGRDPLRTGPGRTLPTTRNMSHASRRILVQADRVLKQFRAQFLGKASPVHFFWGSFDMAVNSLLRTPRRPD